MLCYFITGSVWNEKNTEILLMLYKKYKETANRWTKISKDLLEAGVTASAEKCRLKIRQLEKKFENQKAKKQQSPELEEVFGSEHPCEILESSAGSFSFYTYL